MRHRPLAKRRNALRQVRPWLITLKTIGLVNFLEGYATAIGVEILDDAVTDVSTQSTRNQQPATEIRPPGVSRSLCRLFRLRLASAWKTLNEPFVSFKKTLTCEAVIVGGWDRSDEVIKPYTTCETMDAGWCWQIEHENRINRGYVYCPAFISDEQAELEFRQKNPKVGPTRIVRFVSGRYERAWVNNVVAIGNAAGFVEPLEASSLGVICARSILLTNILLNCNREVRPTQVVLFNRDNAANWDSIRDFLAVHYRFNTRLDTPFWQHCRNETDLAGAAAIVEHYQANGPDPFWAQTLFSPFEAFGIAAYFALFVGQRVPFRNSREISANEIALWNARRRSNHDQAAKVMAVKEALDTIRSPKWKWI